jgi:hypothetical protein
MLKLFRTLHLDMLKSGNVTLFFREGKPVGACVRGKFYATEKEDIAHIAGGHEIKEKPRRFFEKFLVRSAVL